YNNTPIHPYGSTMYPHWYYNGTLHRGGGWTYTAFKSYIDQIISMAQQAHLNSLRPTNFFDGTTYGDWYNATIWSNMDYLFQEADPNHLISSGGPSHLNQADCGIDWKSIFSLPHINMAAIHVYSDNDRTITMPMVAEWAASNGKPFTVEEFGFQQGEGDAQRSADFQNVYTLGRRFGVTSMIFWNLGPEVS